MFIFYYSQYNDVDLAYYNIVKYSVKSTNNTLAAGAVSDFTIVVALNEGGGYDYTVVNVAFSNSATSGAGASLLLRYIDYRYISSDYSKLGILCAIRNTSTTTAAKFDIRFIVLGYPSTNVTTEDQDWM